MAPYQPTSRRPIAAQFRATAQGAVSLCAKYQIHPDVISYSSILMSLLAGLCFWQAGSYPALLLVGPLFCYLRLWMNMLDGMVALATGQASLHGEIINEFPDRISDILIFTGVAHSGLVHSPLGYWVAILAVLTAYAGLFGQALGLQREFRGWMSKQWRMVALHIGAWLMYFSLRVNSSLSAPAGLTLLDWTLLLMALGCVQTIAVRLRHILQGLREKAG